MRAEALFISDLHLSGASPAVVHKFLGFLASTASQSERLYILGDLYDYYLGDDDNTWPFPEIRKALANLKTTGTRVYFQHGNRDFLLGSRFCEETGVTLLDDYAVIELHGKPVLLTHGDLLCTDDIQYQEVRSRIRTPEWQEHALNKPLWMRRLYGRWYRYKSRKHKGQKTREIMDVNAETVQDVMQRFGVKLLIHGHTHRPGIHEFEMNGAPCQRYVLPEWNGHEWVLCFTDSGVERLVTS